MRDLGDEVETSRSWPWGLDRKVLMSKVIRQRGNATREKDLVTGGSRAKLETRETRSKKAELGPGVGSR